MINLFICWFRPSSVVVNILFQWCRQSCYYFPPRIREEIGQIRTLHPINISIVVNRLLCVPHLNLSSQVTKTTLCSYFCCYYFYLSQVSGYNAIWIKMLAGFIRYIKKAQMIENIIILEARFKVAHIINNIPCVQFTQAIILERFQSNFKKEKKKKCFLLNSSTIQKHCWVCPWKLNHFGGKFFGFYSP